MRILFLLAMLACAVSAHIIPGSNWLALKDMPIQRSDAPAVVVNGVIYISGGCVSFAQPVKFTDGGCENITNQTLALDTKQGLNSSWIVLADMPRPRYRQAVAVVGSSLIYHIGGRTIDPIDSLNDAPIDTIDVYNITSNSWFSLPNQTCNCLSMDSSDGAAFVIGDQLYYTGGYATHQYITLNATVVLNTSLPVAQQQFQAGIVPDRWYPSGDLSAIVVGNIAYVLGGWGLDWCNPLSHVSAYNATSNTWTNKTDFHHGRGDFAIASVADRYIYVAGGEKKSPGDCNVAYPVGEVERYDTWTDTWIEYAPIALTSFRFTGVAVKDLIFAIGGQGSDEHETWTGHNDTDAYPLLPEVFFLNTTTYDIMIAQSSSSSSTGTYKPSGDATAITVSSMVLGMIAMVAMAIF